MRVRAVLLALLTGALLLAPTAALAATPDPGPTTHPGEITYHVTRTGTAYNSFDGSSGTPYGPDSYDVTLTCAAGVCTYVGGPEDGIAREIVDGHGSWDTPLVGQVCVEGYQRASHTTVDLVDDTLTSTTTYDSIPMTDCGGGSSIGSYGGTETTVGTVIAGDVCAVDGSCVDPVIVPTTGTGPRAWAEPTVLSALPAVATAAAVPNIVWAALGTVVLVLLLAIPTHFFNAATERASELAGAWWRRIRPPQGGSASRTDAGAGTVPTGGVALHGWPVAAGGVLLAGILSAFADPAFGPDAAGARTVLSLLVAFGLDVVLGWFAVVLLVRRTHPNVIATFAFKPVSLVVVALAVLLDRVTGFAPGIVFGLVAGVVFGGLVATAQKARVALIALGWAFAVGILSWIAYSAVVAVAGPAVFVTETLSAAAIAGISALPIALLPLRGLAGRSVWDWNRGIWAAAYAIGLFAFLLVLLPLPASWATVGVDLWVWAGLYVAYAVGGLGIWLVLTRPWRQADVGQRADQA